MTDPQTFQTETAEALVRSLHRRHNSATRRKCSCDGDGWIVTLDRDRYRSPADAGMVRYTRCACVEQALSATG
jgi:hypothetical protein